MQFVFNDDAVSGTFNPTGIVDCGNSSVLVEQNELGYIAT